MNKRNGWFFCVLGIQQKVWTSTLCASAEPDCGGIDAGEGFDAGPKLSPLLGLALWFPSDWESYRALNSVPLMALEYGLRSCYWSSWEIWQRLPCQIPQSSLMPALLLNSSTLSLISPFFLSTWCLILIAPADSGKLNEQFCKIGMICAPCICAGVKLFHFA